MYRTSVFAFLSSALLCCVVAILSVICVPKLFAAEGNELKVKIMTFNIRYYRAKDGPDDWNLRKQMVVDVIKKSGAEVIGFQEAEKPQIDWLKTQLSEFDFLITYSDGKTHGHSNAILYRKNIFAVKDWGTFWLSDTPNEPNTANWGNKSKRFCTWARLIDSKNGRGFYYYNTHLDHRSQYSREKSMLLITKTIEQRSCKEPVVLTGDFNSQEDNPVLKFLGGEEIVVDETPHKTPIVLVDSFRVKHGMDAEAGTFNDFGRMEKFSKIDYVLVEKATNVLNAEVITYNENGRYPSDHCPVIAELCF